MAVDLTELTQVMTEALLRDLGDDVDLIIRYGSHLAGTAHAYSDLDISYVPVHASTGYHITVTVDEMLCDLYPIHWSQLESMARFENVSSTVLMTYEILYQRSDAAATRIQQLADQLHRSLQPAAHPMMVRRAQEYFQRAGYPHYLLRQQALAGHQLAALQQAQSIVGTVVHALAICNQQVIDTRKLKQVLALPKLPPDFATILTRATTATDPHELLATSEELLDVTHAFLLAAQRQLPEAHVTYADAFGAGYPELKNDLRHMLLACEREDLFSLRRLLVSLYHETALAITHAATGVHYNEFSSLAAYEHEFSRLGFPPLLPALARADFDALHRQCLAFDAQLQHFLTAHDVNLYAFASVDELRAAR